jgi:hypothetical protein
MIEVLMIVVAVALMRISRRKRAPVRVIVEHRRQSEIERLMDLIA